MCFRWCQCCLWNFTETEMMFNNINVQSIALAMQFCNLEIGNAVIWQCGNVANAFKSGWTTFSDHYCANLSYKLFLRSFVINKLASIEIDHQKNSLSFQMHVAEGWREGKWRTKKDLLQERGINSSRSWRKSDIHTDVQWSVKVK